MVASFGAALLPCLLVRCGSPASTLKAAECTGWLRACARVIGRGATGRAIRRPGPPTTREASRLSLLPSWLRHCSFRIQLAAVQAKH